jgi:hypothetical protein
MKGDREVCVLVGRFALLFLAWLTLQREVAVNGSEAVHKRTLTEFPILERPCEVCQGKGGRDGYHGWEECLSCDGTGYLATEFGKAILDLVRHNGESIVRKSLSRVLE